jgi:hypothetical protein
MVGVVGAPSSGIELVLKQISLPVAQIRAICKNGPQVSIDDIKWQTETPNQFHMNTLIKQAKLLSMKCS